MLKKQSLLLPLLFLGLLAQAQTPSAKKSWTSADRAAFISSCIETAKAHLSPDSARYYCFCMQEFTEKKYPDADEAGKVTEADIAGEDWQKAIRGCGGGNWSAKDRSDFLKDCISTAKEGGLSEEKASSYCECMLYKIEKIYPDSQKAVNELNEETLKSEKWKAIIKGCLDF